QHLRDLRELLRVRLVMLVHVRQQMRGIDVLFMSVMVLVSVLVIMVMRMNVVMFMIVHMLMIMRVIMPLAVLMAVLVAMLIRVFVCVFVMSFVHRDPPFEVLGPALKGVPPASGTSGGL
ncbi:MAG: hypothetical protein II772_06050, partial [Lachnospiraceae bacterium]|nr:hypothetical protein [Lachnospiraceae bacterium]